MRNLTRSLLLSILLPASLAASTASSAVAVSPDGGVLLAGSASGVQRSTDGGATWKQVLRVATDREGYVVASIAFDPESSDVYAATTAGLFRSADRGVTWNDEDLLGGTMPGRVIFDPVKKSTMYVATADGLYMTSDRGASWKEISPNGRHFAIRSLSIREKPFTIYAINEEGLFASSDRGATWKALTDERDDLSAVAFQPPATLHLSANGSHYLRSEDAGETWSAAARQWPHFSDFFVVSDAAYATASGATWRTTDRGESWTELKSENGLALRTLVAHPKKRGVIWAAGAKQAVVSSADGGTTWKTLALSK